MADDENSDFVGNAVEQKVIKGTAANSLFGHHREKISCVSGIPPSGEPDRLRRPKMNQTGDGNGHCLLERFFHREICIIPLRL